MFFFCLIDTVTYDYDTPRIVSRDRFERLDLDDHVSGVTHTGVVSLNMTRISI